MLTPSSDQDRPAKDLVEATAERYAAQIHQRFVRSKLRYDPVYLRLLKGGHLPSHGRLVDLGCGRGIMLALLASARKLAQHGWPAAWPAPPALELQGIETQARTVTVARQALCTDAHIIQANVTDYALPPCEAVLLLDVLMYVPAIHHIPVIRRASAALKPGGVLLMREADTKAGLRFTVTRYIERLRAFSRGKPWARYYYRSAREWTSLLEQEGFSVQVRPISEGTPFANQLFIATKVDG